MKKDKTHSYKTYSQLHMDYTCIPRKRLRQLWMLENAVKDAMTAARYLCRTYLGVPIVLVGFSFGGSVIWPTARLLFRERESESDGVCALAGSARGGEAFERAGLATKSSIARLDRRSRRTSSIAKLFVHGSHDKNVALDVAEFLFRASAAPKCFARVNFSAHSMEAARDTVFAFWRDWICAVFARWHRRREQSETITDRFSFSRHDVDEERFCRKYNTARVRLGRPLKKRVGEAEGKERWRCKPSKKRLRKIQCDASHPLAGLVGFSM